MAPQGPLEGRPAGIVALVQGAAGLRFSGDQRFQWVKTLVPSKPQVIAGLKRMFIPLKMVFL